MKKLLSWFLLLAIIQEAPAQTTPLWLRYPSISPDGKTIVFGYKGDLYKVASSGGQAYPITMHEAHDYSPVWSHDGKSIAFASDRFGNFDVYVMPAEGGEATRLTYNSAGDVPCDFSVDDKNVIFRSGRNDVSTSVRFPSPRVFQKLYSVPVKGGRSIMLLSAGTENVHYNSKGDKLVFQDSKGFEDAWRKHHTSSVTRDIWLYDLKEKGYKKLSSFEGEDREPLFSSDDQSIYYLSEKNGTQNIYKASLAGTAEKQLTDFKDNPVRHLSRTADNTLCFSWNGEIYTMREGGKPSKINVLITSESRSNAEKILPINNGATQIELSPSAKEIAFVFRGEVFVTSVEGGTTKRITNTPQQERSIKFSPDGRSIYYAAERNGSWNIMRTSIVRKEEPYFFASTILKEEPVISTDKEEFQPEISPNGKEIAYLEDRNVLKIYNLDKKTSRVIIPAGQNFSYADGDQAYVWSPDGKYIAAKSSKGRYGASEVMVYKADGSDGIDLTQSGFSDGDPHWAFGNRALIWVSDKEGKKPLAYQGAREVDIYAMFFEKDLYDRFNLSKEEFALLKEREDKEKRDTLAKSSKNTSKILKDTVKKIDFTNLDFADIDNRKIKLTNGSVNLSSYQLSSNGEKLYYMARYEQGYDVWVLDTRTKELKVLAKLGGGNGGMDLSKDGKSLFVLADGKISKIDVEGGKVTPVTINGEMMLNTAKERDYIFEHAWRQVKKKFYDPKLHGVDWTMYKNTYERFLPHINNNYDFQELLSEMLGELNASHTGGRYSPQLVGNDITPSLGLLFDEMSRAKGLKITDVLSGGPIDKASSKIRKGQILEKIDGEEITDDRDWSRLINRKAGKNVLLSVYDPTNNTRWDEIIKPITAVEENTLLYKRWVKNMRALVDKLSNGKVGYVHVQGMNDPSYRTVYDEALGRNADKQALIVDTRFNGGGWLHEDLSNFLAGKQYIRFAPYGFSAEGGEPNGKWYKPSCILVGESNYSDAHTFPYAYRAKGIGKLIGMPVPGTSTSVWWETQIDPTVVFGIPMIANIGIVEKRALENFQLEPDIKVANEYNDVLSGKDAQLEAAVKEMLKEIADKKNTNVTSGDN